jgi:hypothetical protein
VKGTASVLTAAATLAVLLGAKALALSIGDAMPVANAALVNVDGRELSLAKVVGPKGTLVIFSCNHCPWVKAWEGRMVELGNAYGTKGVGIIAVNSNDPKAYPDNDLPRMQERARDRNYLFPYAVDTTTEVARAFGATHTPEVFLFDASGRLVYHGTIDDNARDEENVKHTYLRDALDAVLAGKVPVVQETKALGCTIVLRKPA